MTKSGISKVYFTELPKEVQERFHYDATKAAEYSAQRTEAFRKQQEESRQKLSGQKAAITEHTPPAGQLSPAEQSSPVVIQEIPQTPSQLDNAQFEQLRLRDWYEDLKVQVKLKNHADWIVALIDDMKENDPKCDECTPTLFEMIAVERKAHRNNYGALSSIASKILETKSYDDYKKLKTIEDQILDNVETQKIQDQADVAKLRLSVSERDAAILEIVQRHRFNE
jgi:hypothetical protein